MMLAIDHRLIKVILTYLMLFLQNSSTRSRAPPSLDSSLKGGGQVDYGTRYASIDLRNDEDHPVILAERLVESRKPNWSQLIAHSPGNKRPINKCQEAERQLDKCSAQLIGLGSLNGALLPEDDVTLNTVYCPNIRSLVKCVKNNSRCHKPFERQVIKWVIRWLNDLSCTCLQSNSMH